MFTILSTFAVLIVITVIVFGVISVAGVLAANMLSSEISKEEEQRTGRMQG